MSLRLGVLVGFESAAVLLGISYGLYVKDWTFSLSLLFTIIAVVYGMGIGLLFSRRKQWRSYLMDSPEADVLLAIKRLKTRGFKGNREK